MFWMNNKEEAWMGRERDEGSRMNDPGLEARDGADVLFIYFKGYFFVSRARS